MYEKIRNREEKYTKNGHENAQKKINRDRLSFAHIWYLFAMWWQWKSDTNIVRDLTYHTEDERRNETDFFSKISQKFSLHCNKTFGTLKSFWKITAPRNETDM